MWELKKIPGGSITDSTLIKGFVLKREPEGTIKHVKDAKIVVFTCNIDVSSLDTKETVLIESKRRTYEIFKDRRRRDWKRN